MCLTCDNPPYMPRPLSSPFPRSLDILFWPFLTFDHHSCFPPGFADTCQGLFLKPRPDHLALHPAAPWSPHHPPIRVWNGSNQFILQSFQSVSTLRAHDAFHAILSLCILLPLLWILSASFDYLQCFKTQLKPYPPPNLTVSSSLFKPLAPWITPCWKVSCSSVASIPILFCECTLRARPVLSSPPSAIPSLYSDTFGTHDYLLRWMLIKSPTAGLRS